MMFNDGIKVIIKICEKQLICSIVFHEIIEKRAEGSEIPVQLIENLKDAQLKTKQV